MPVRARARQVALGSAAVVLLAAGACVVLATMPVTQTETATVNVIQQGQFSYSGEAVPGTTYPTGVIATGDTVWTQLSGGLTVSFTNTVTGPDWPICAASCGWMSRSPRPTAGAGSSPAVPSWPWRTGRRRPPSPSTPLPRPIC